MTDLTPRALTPDEMEFFRHNGYLKFPQSLPGDFVDRLRSRIQIDADNEVEPVGRNSEGIVVRLSQVWNRGGIYQEALAHSCILQPLKGLIGPNIELILNRHNHATTRLGPALKARFHRDVLQWTRTIATVIVYLEESTVENGATQVLPGSHLWPGISTLHNPSTEETKGLLDQAVPVPMPAGGLLCIDSMIFHTAGPKKTTETRMSMTAGYHSVDELNPDEPTDRILVSGERVSLSNRAY